MTNPEYYTDTIARIYHDSETNTLALLKVKSNLSLYVALINLNNNTTERVETNLFVKSEELSLSHTNYNRKLEEGIISLYNKRLTNDGNADPFLIINWLFNFEVDFDSRHILIQAQYQLYPEVENQTQAHQYSCSYLLLNLNGEVINNAIIYKKSDWDSHQEPECNFIRFLDKNTLIYIGGGYPLSKELIQFWNTESNEHFKTYLLSEDWLLEYEGYDYIQNYAFHKQKRLIAALFIDPNDDDSLKTLNIKPDNTIGLLSNIIFDRREMDLRGMVFNQAGDELAVMEVKFIETGKYAIYIKCYSINDLSNPIRIVATGLIEPIHNLKGLCYYNNGIVCFAISGEMRLFDFEKSEIITLVQISKWNIYFFSLNKFFYVRERQVCIYDLENRKLTVSEEPPSEWFAQIREEKRRASISPITFHKPQKEKYLDIDIKTVIRIIVFIILTLIWLVSLTHHKTLH